MNRKRIKEPVRGARVWLDITAVKTRYNVSDTQVRRFMRTDPDFPKPVQFGERMARWDETWLDAYDAKKLAQQGLQEPA